MNNIRRDPGTVLEANWEILKTENPTLYAQLRPHIRRDGTVTSLPDAIEVPVLRWVVDQRAKAQAAADEAKRQADLEAERKKVAADIEARRKAEYWNPTKLAEKERLDRRLAMYRLDQWCDERGLVRDPKNAELVAAWIKNNGGVVNQDAIDKAIEALSPQLLWEGFAARLRA